MRDIFGAMAQHRTSANHGAFSRPGHWLLWLGYPWVRRLQRRFGFASLAAIQRAVASSL